MEVKIKLNGKTVVDDVPADMLFIDFVRAHGYKSVKHGCETSACGSCTVMLDDVPALSCSTLAARADGRSVYTLEGLQAEASEFVGFIADQGAEQCGFCGLHPFAHGETGRAAGGVFRPGMFGGLCAGGGGRGEEAPAEGACRARAGHPRVRGADGVRGRGRRHRRPRLADVPPSAAIRAAGRRFRRRCGHARGGGGGAARRGAS